MNKYHIIVLGHARVIDEIIIADEFNTSANEHSYIFRINKQFVASYPVDKTIIKKLKND